jgi:hypothetical protein
MTQCEAVSVRDEVTASRTLLATDGWFDRLLAEGRRGNFWQGTNRSRSRGRVQFCPLSGKYSTHSYFDASMAALSG